MDKLKRYPFATWAMGLLTVAFLAWMFGPDNVWALLTAWVTPPQ